MTAYQPRRDGRFEYAGDAIEHIEQHNCIRGCAVPDPKDIAEFGPGGACPILARVAAGDGEPISELDDQGRRIVCLAREVTHAAEPTPDVPSLPLWSDS